jgi:hypothetical protein
MPSSPTNRVIVWIDPEASVTARDDGPMNTVIRRVDVEIGNTIVGIGRMGVASDGEIIGVSDRMVAAFTELRTAAARRLSEREGPPRTDGGTVCQSPICPRQAITHFTGDAGCSVAVVRPPTVLRTASAERPPADEAAGSLSTGAPPSGGRDFFSQPPRLPEHDEELHSGHANPDALFAGCPACDAAFVGGTNATAVPPLISIRMPITGAADQTAPITFRIPGGGIAG